MTDRSDNSAIQPRQGRRLARRVAIGGAIGFGALLTVIVIDPGVAGITERGSLALLARLLGWKKPGNRPATTTDSAIPPGAPIGGPFTLINQDGQTMTRASFRGRWMLVYLGYTRCPDECPLTMEKLAIMMKALGPQSRRVAPVFVTVDPIHDTPPVLKAYLAKFSNQITGLTGTLPEISKVAREYGAYFSTTDHEASSKTLLSHSTFLYLMAPNGTFENMFPVSITVPQLVHVMKKVLSR